MEYEEEAPLDLSASNSSSVSSPPQSPDHVYNRDRERHTGSPAQDSDDSDHQRPIPGKSAKSYKKAIMKRYLDTESSPIVSHVRSSYSKNSSNSRQQQQHHQQQQKLHSFYTPEEEEESGLLKLVDTLELQQKDRPLHLQEFMAPSQSSVHNSKEPYIIHPAAHVGHRTAFSVSHPNILVNKEGIPIVSHPGHDSLHDSSVHSQLRHHPSSSHNQSSLRHNSSHNQNSTFHPHHRVHRDKPLLLQDLTEQGLYRTEAHSMSSSKVIYTIHPANREGPQTTYTISHPNIFVDGSHSPPHDDSEVLEIVDSIGTNQEIQRNYPNSFDKNWEVQTVDYADIGLHYPIADSNSRSEGVSLRYIDGPTYEFDGNLVNMQNANPYNLSPKDQTFNDPVESLHTIYANNSGLVVNNNDDANLGADEIKRTRAPRTKPKTDIVISLSKSCLEVVLRKVPGVGGRARWPKSWEFVMRLIMHEETNPYLVQWEDESQYIFRLMQADTITHIWNTNSPRACDSYNNFARSLRYHYKKQILIPIRERQLVYQCGPKAIEYINKLRQC